ncbi:MAG: DNA repair protein RecO [Lysobacterales bacterium]
MNAALTPAFVLHRRNYQEASLLVDLLTRDRGRVCAVARGARKSRRHRSGLLQPYVPLQVGLGGRGQLATLGVVEAEGGPVLTVGSRSALVALYVNELVLRLTGREDPNPSLFQQYLKTLIALACGPAAPALRQFEMALLASQGYALALSADVDTGQPLDPQQYYSYVVEEGPVSGDVVGGSPRVRGATMLGLAKGESGGADAQREARVLLRYVLDHYLGSKPLKSRQLFQQMTFTETTQ